MSTIPLYLNPEKDVYSELLKRSLADDSKVEKIVDDILENVRTRGDEALREYERKFGNNELVDLYVSDEEFKRAEELVSEDVKAAIEVAYKNITAFHKAQLREGERVTTMEGVDCWRKVVPIQRVGLYIPGGTAPLFSTVLMLSIPAKVASCPSITLATPAQGGSVNPVVLYTARRCGVDRVLKVGGAQAIAALAYGTESVERVDKIFGPGNRFVAFAKNRVSSFCAIDMVAGPSEVMVIADEKANPLFVATDLLSQAEHGKDSQVILLIRAKDEESAKRIFARIDSELAMELERLGRKEYMLPSLSHSAAIALYDDKKLMSIANEYAPEHLIINTENYMELAEKVVSAGSVFLGPYSPESAGDYASGTNHTLPTSGHASASSGVSVDSYIKKITFQHLSKKGIDSLAPAVVTMAMAENLSAHAEAARVRMR
ncbi:MAG: histidinol dehydrogenase [Sphaerochaetaceae bacterium]|nr:histidinol dehydrogenase [Sphaerochaetaceae bacterium]